MAIITAVGFVGVTALAAHSLYSWMGFNPTDDGYYLALARRLIEGEVPHRDFISYQPVGSAFLHAPAVLFGGERTFWISRFFVWFEFAAIAWAWATIAERWAGGARTLVSRAAVALLGFVFSAHYFPPMAWSTIDGLFFVSVGLLFCAERKPNSRLVGYALIGAACLFRQSFLVLVPAVVIAFSDQRSPRAWAAAAAPSALYLGFVTFAGALPDAWSQLTAQTSFLETGVLRYAWGYAFPWGIVLGYVAFRIIDGKENDASARFAVNLAAVSIFAMVAVATLLMAEGRFLWTPPFGFVGVALGAGMCRLVDRRTEKGRAIPFLIAALTAWSCSISVGYNTPALATGSILAVLLTEAKSKLRWGNPTRDTGFRGGVLALVVFLSLFSFDAGRRSHVYLDRPASDLRHFVPPSFKGLLGIKIGENTHAFLADLDDAIRLAGAREFALLPDLAGYWVKADRRNPLPSDWPIVDNLIRPTLVARVTNALDRRRGRLLVIVQKVRANSLAHGFIPLSSGQRYMIARHVREKFRKIGETRYFTLYE